jgi:antitoxin component of MazEF toxin-antitoxin module
VLRKVRKIGGSHTVALTPYAMEKLKINTNDEVDVQVVGNKIIITKPKEDKKK